MRTVVLVTLTSALFLVAGCADRKQPVQAKPTKPMPTERTFTTVEMGAEHLDPNLIAETAGAGISGQMFDTLVTVEAGNPELVGSLATQWTTSPNGKAWTFTLRQGVVWSDGKPFTSADVLFSWERALNPKTASRNAQQYWVVAGAKEYNRGDSSDFSTVGIKANGPHEITITLVSPAPFFLDLLSIVSFAPVPKHAVEAHGKKWTQPEHIVVSGPFKMTLRKEGDRIEMVKNPQFWDAANVWLNKVIFYEMANAETAHDWFEMDKVHWTPGLVPLSKAKTLLESGRTDFHIDPILCTYYYMYNVTKKPFDNPVIRHAFNMALDKKKLTTQVLGMGQKPARHLVPPAFRQIRDYRAPLGDTFNPTEARKLLAEAGYPNGQGLPEVTLIYNTSDGHRRIAEFFQRNIKANLGVEVKINNMEWKSLLAAAHAGDFQIARTSWCADYPDPENFLSILVSGGENNYGRYVNPQYDDLLNALRVEGDIAKRNALTRQAEELLNTEQPVMPLYFYTRAYMLKDWVRGIEVEPVDRHYFRYVWFGPPGSAKPKAP